jgi:hypothetical protein
MGRLARIIRLRTCQISIDRTKKSNLSRKSTKHWLPPPGFPPVCQIEQNNLGFDAILGDAYEER